MKQMTAIGLVGLASLAVASRGLAGGAAWDYKSQSGAACQPQTGAQSADFERQPFGIENISPDTSRTVICPIVRDSLAPTDLDMGVTVTRGTRCDFNSMTGQGDQVGSFISPTYTEAIDQDRETQFFSVLPASVSAQDGYYAIMCTLPPGGQVFSYGGGELAETTDQGT